MTIFKKITALALVLILLLSLPLSAHARQENADDLIRKLLNYYQYHQWDAQLDFELLLSQMEALDPALSETWADIMDFWIRVNRDMEHPGGVLPDGLPQDGSLCIAVMGYHLNSDGSIRNELGKRLQVTLESAEKYPNAYILVTGGGTASEKKDATEAGQMAKWLIRKGISSDRIIVEDNALSTVENAEFGCRLLYRDYPQVKNLAVITSDYHIFRSSLYFNTQAALDTYASGREPIRVIATATCAVSPHAAPDIETQASGLSLLTGLDLSGMGKPRLSALEALRVSGTTEYPLGAELDLITSAVYSSGYSREVTQNVTYSGYDFGKSGTQTITVRYAEGDTVKTATIDIHILPPPTQAPTQPPTEVTVPEETTPVPEAAETTKPDLSKPLLIFAVCVLLLIILLHLKARQARKRRRRPRPVIKLDQ